MTAQKNPRDLADELTGGADFVRTLVRAADDKVRLYFEDEKLLGPYGEVLRRHAVELSALLSLTGRCLDRMDGDLAAVSDLLYELEEVSE